MDEITKKRIDDLRKYCEKRPDVLDNVIAQSVILTEYRHQYELMNTNFDLTPKQFFNIFKNGIVRIDNNEKVMPDELILTIGQDKKLRIMTKREMHNFVLFIKDLNKTWRIIE